MKTRTTKFIVDSLDYFAAHTTGGTIRFGLCGCHTIEVSPDHAAHHALLNCTTSDEVEEIFDATFSGSTPA